MSSWKWRPFCLGLNVFINASGDEAGVFRDSEVNTMVVNDPGHKDKKQSHQSPGYLLSMICQSLTYMRMLIFKNSVH